MKKKRGRSQEEHIVNFGAFIEVQRPQKLIGLTVGGFGA
jgi:hypothetical protein